MWHRDWAGRSQVEVGGAPSTLCPTSCAPSHLPVPGPQSSLLHCMGGGGGQQTSPFPGMPCPNVPWPKLGSPLCQAQGGSMRRKRRGTRHVRAQDCML